MANVRPTLPIGSNVCLCMQVKERTGERRNCNRKRKRDGQGALGVSLCKDGARLYSGFICVMPCDSIVWSRSTELVFPPSQQPPALDKAIWICSTPSTNAYERLTVLEALSTFLEESDGCIVWATMRVWYVGT